MGGYTGPMRFIVLAAACLLAACSGSPPAQVAPTSDPARKSPAVKRTAAPASAAPSAAPSTVATPTASPMATPAAPTPAATSTPAIASFRFQAPGDLIAPDRGVLSGRVAAMAGVLANNGASYRLHALDETSLAGTTVLAIGPDGKPLAGVKPALTAADGSYTLTDVPRDRPYVVRALIKTAAGKEAALESIGRSVAEASPLLITTASALVTVAFVGGTAPTLTGFDDARFQAAVDETAAKLTPADVPDFADGADVKAKVDKLAQGIASLQNALQDVKLQLARVGLEVGSITGGGLTVSDPDPATLPPFHVLNLAGSPTAGALDRKGILARFRKPIGVVVGPGGTCFVSEFGNHTIRRIASDGKVSTFAGITAVAGHQDGAAQSARFAAPIGLALAPDGALHVADYGAACLRRIAPDGQVTTTAGDGTPESRDGAPAISRLNGPAGLACDPDGNVYVAEFDGNRIRKLAPDGALSTLVDAGGAAGLTKPFGLAWDSKSSTLVVADCGGNAIKRVTREGVVTTIAATGFSAPAGVAVDGQGTIYVADTNNARIRRIRPDGTVDTVAGSGLSGYSDAAGPSARFGAPYLLTLDPAGWLIAADYPNHAVRRIKLPGPL